MRQFRTASSAPSRVPLLEGYWSEAQLLVRSADNAAGTRGNLYFLIPFLVQGFNDSLDSGWVQSTGWMARIFLEGVSPVKGEDPWGYQANLAIREHE